MWPRGLPLLLWVFFVHLGGIYLYTRGFLLTRLALAEISSCPNNDCTLAASYKRVVFLIIDALRFDFISSDPPQPPSPYHHNVLRLPAELSAEHPDRSLLFNAFADPPTTTLQRIKGLTTGSLPTFIDMGSNFGGSSILEDSIIGQLRAANKQIAFMGDDTWTTVFPTSFAPNMSFPYDSFNVEDLHTVDEGVISHIFPLLRDPSKSWDFLIGHFLGVDHVGHRVGPDHPIMKAKLEQMDSVLRSIVELMDDDTLLVLLGDHGMDRKGDHGGDGELETSSGLWIYSKAPRLFDPSASIPAYFLTNRTFPGALVAHRSVEQIDLVPSLSLLLGLPIPFNNLGTIIPELFWTDKDGSRFKHALDLNAAQVKRYLDAYRASSSGGELESAWQELEKVWEGTKAQGHMKWMSANMFTRYALAACRTLWAQFNVSLMSLGLGLLGLGTIATWVLYRKMGELKDEWVDSADAVARISFRWSGVGGVLGLLLHFPLTPYVKGVDLFDSVLFGASLVSSIAVIVIARPSISLSTLDITALPLALILHTLSFMSNSFTIWEDHIVTYLLLSSLVPFVLIGLTAPIARLRNRILGFSLLFAICVRLMAISTVCREEQQPHCHVTFFASSSITVPPVLILILSVPAAVLLPWIVKRFLHISKSDRGIASVLTPLIFPSVLLLGSLVWILEWADTASIFESEWSGLLRISRTILAWVALILITLVAFSLWWQIPLCLEVKASDPQVPSAKKEVTVIGFANSFGSPYFIFWFIFFCLVYITTQLTGQVILILSTIALLSYLEIVDSVRDVRGLNLAFSSATPSKALEPDALRDTLSTVGLRYSEIVPLALLAVHTFHGTGHQSTISSIQWKAAFLLTSTVTHPISPLLVILNFYGPIFLFSLATPLVALWNTPPLPHPSSASNARRLSIRSALGMMLYFGVLLLGSAASSAWLRRHLMVWKIFAPRFMNAAVSLVVVDVAVLLAVGVGVDRVEKGLSRLFGNMPAINAGQK